MSDLDQWMSVVVLGILLSDIALALLDPRIRLGAGSEK
jgi:ABC-type dipeptide/oligopeptide/nickel transport system permease component